MTIVSVQELSKFLNKYKPTGRLADYGGTDKIGGDIVKRLITFNESVVAGVPDTTIDYGIQHLGVGGKSLNKNPPQYFALDYDSGIDLMKPVKGQKFDYGICMDLLEHVDNPFIVANNISDSLKKGALLFVTAPFVWQLHHYPIDCWRFCPQGLERLFPKMKPVVPIEVVRDETPGEQYKHTRVVGIFKKK